MQGYNSSVETRRLDRWVLSARTAYETKEGARGGNAVRKWNCQEDGISGGVVTAAQGWSSAGNPKLKTSAEKRKANGTTSACASGTL